MMDATNRIYVKENCAYSLGLIQDLKTALTQSSYLVSVNRQDLV